jgi:hypothetical protein
VHLALTILALVPVVLSLAVIALHLGRLIVFVDHVNS